MNPDVTAALDGLQAQRVLPAETAHRLGAVARGELVSVRIELRILLYAGVLLIMAGVGLLVRENLDRLGPVAVACALALATAACLTYVFARGPAYANGVVASPTFAFDYVLLLGVLLLGATLAYVEVQFTALGRHFAWHFLLMTAIAAALAFRFDSRAVFGLALTSFAAWRGVSISWSALDDTLFGRGPEILRWNALGCGVAFALLGHVLSRGRVKPHFEGTATHLGVLLALGALLSGAGTYSPGELLHALGLLGAGTAVAAWGAFSRRFSLVALGTLAAYAALVVLVVRMEPPVELGLLLLAGSALGLLFGLLAARRWLREEED
jgi:hypothetical protein